ncbi:MAG: hypothetical protein ACLP59_05375 [Bryobacteraceae bacterium]
MKSEQQRSKFVLCVRNGGSEDLEIRKFYQVLPDRSAGRDGYVRIIDESGEDYLYPADYFVAVRLPAEVKHCASVPDPHGHAPAMGELLPMQARLLANTVR